MSSEASTSEGGNMYGLIFDELHTQKKRDLWDALRYSGEARDEPLLLSITTAGWDQTSICFEQSYSHIDGDSATAAEVCALLSAISEIPIKQEYAITGSVNQMGEIQPIGGVTEKVEGFFHICSKKGLTGTQGVIIPHQNVQNLILSDTVLNAVKNKKFQIFTVKHIYENYTNNI